MKKTILLIIMTIGALTILFSSIPTTEIRDFLYPIEMLKKKDIGTEEAVCTEIIDTNSIKVTIKNSGVEKIITFLGIEEQNETEFAPMIIEMSKKYLEGKEVYLSYDWKAQNDNGELTAYVWVPTFTPVGSYELLWNEVLLLNGYGKLSSTPINLPRAFLFTDSYKYARDKKLGMWKNIETEKPIDYSRLPEEVQEYIKQRYEEGFDKKQATTEDSTDSTSTGAIKATNDFLKELMVGTEWGMTPAQLESDIKAQKYDYNYEGSLMEQSWYFHFDYARIGGIGADKGKTVKRLDAISYRLRGDYDENQTFDIFEKIKENFVKNFGDPVYTDKADNIYSWHLVEDKTYITLYPRNSWRGIYDANGDTILYGSSGGMFHIAFNGELGFDM